MVRAIVAVVLLVVASCGSDENTLTVYSGRRRGGNVRDEV